MQKWIESIIGECNDCGLCVQECAFLQRYGTPLELANLFTKEEGAGNSFNCSLCGLCKAVCPKSVNPSLMFFEQRKIDYGRRRLPALSHFPLRIYERLGSSPLFTWYGLPSNCTTVYFPGCSLPGRRTARVGEVYHSLQQSIPQLGLVLDCCCKPSHDLGAIDVVSSCFLPMVEGLQQKGVSRVLVNCPSCYNLFQRYGGGMEVETVYSALVDSVRPTAQLSQQLVTVHDPCSVREFTQIHRDVRILCENLGLRVEEMEHNGATTLCCGEGGGVGYIDRKLAGSWGEKRKQEAAGRRIVTYCGGCATVLERLTPTCHILDLLYDPEATIRGEVTASRSPGTYISRLALKKRLPDLVRPKVIGQRGINGRLVFRRTS